MGAGANEENLVFRPTVHQKEVSAHSRSARRDRSPSLSPFRHRTRVDAPSIINLSHALSSYISITVESA